MARRTCSLEAHRVPPTPPAAARTGRRPTRPWPSGAHFENTERGRTDVGGDDAAQVFPNRDHMGAILTGAHDPIHFTGGGIVTAEYLVRFGGEVEFAAHVIQAVRPMQRAQIDGAQRLLGYQVDHRNGVVRAAAVVGNVGELAVRGGHLARRSWRRPGVRR